MRYLVTVSTATTSEDAAWSGSVQSPTFLLDSNIQGIRDEAHAERIVSAWLGNAGLNVLAVTAARSFA